MALCVTLSPSAFLNAQTFHVQCALTTWYMPQGSKLQLDSDFLHKDTGYRAVQKCTFHLRTVGWALLIALQTCQRGVLISLGRNGPFVALD